MYSQYGYPNQYQGYTSNYYPELDYSQYQQQYSPQMSEYDISVKYYEDINAQEISITPMNEDEVKDRNERKLDQLNEEDLMLF